METLSKGLLGIHIFSGFLSLVIFWIPMFTKKGGKNHRKLGQIYVKLMWVVVITSFLLSVKNLYIGRTNVGLFLGFIAFLTANPLWYGIAVLKNKKKLSPSYKRNHFLFQVLVFVLGVSLLTYGIYLGGSGSASLFLIFGILGFTNIVPIVNELRNPQETTNWFKDHYVGMISSAIAAYTAFFVFGASKFLGELLSGNWQVVPWVAPTVVGTFILLYMRKYYEKRDWKA